VVEKIIEGMKVSLIITTYNTPTVLKKVTDSILAQNRLPDEVIIADDGSDKETAQVIKGFSEIAPFPVLHVWHEDKGFRLAKIRNEAIKKSTGDYIIVLDGDCIVNKHFISDHISLAEMGCFLQGKRVLISRDMMVAFSHEHANSILALLRMGLTGKISNIHHLVRLPHCFSLKNKKLRGIKGCNMSFFKQDIMAVNGYNEAFIGWGSEDSELAGRFFKYGLMKKVHPFMAICFHLWHPTNKTLKNRNKQILVDTLKSNEYFCKNGLLKKS
jgi:glycosyltransferase involved in cell wall biosynthesis